MDELTALENVELPALLVGRSPRDARRRAEQLLGQSNEPQVLLGRHIIVAGNDGDE